MVNTKQKPIVDTHKIIQKKFMHNNVESHQTTIKKAKKKEQRTTKTTRKQLTKWQ